MCLLTYKVLNIHSCYIPEQGWTEGLFLISLSNQRLRNILSVKNVYKRVVHLIMFEGFMPSKPWVLVFLHTFTQLFNMSSSGVSFLPTLLIHCHIVTAASQHPQLPLQPYSSLMGPRPCPHNKKCGPQLQTQQPQSANAGQPTQPSFKPACQATSPDTGPPDISATVSKTVLFPCNLHQPQPVSPGTVGLRPE